MSQAVTNGRNYDTERTVAGRRYYDQFNGIICLLMVICTIVFGVYMGVVWMKDAYLLPLSRLVVSGNRFYTTHDDIRQAILTLGMPGTFMTQNVKIIQQQIARMPWIKQVSVRKHWPDELKIHLVEYVVPLAYWNDHYLLDNNGKVFHSVRRR